MAGRPRTWSQASNWKRLLPAGAVLLAGLGACGERARLVFGPVTDGQGPDTTIDSPEAADMHIPAGPQFTVSGRSVDLDGVDTVYFVLHGGNQQFTPHVPNEFQDTVRFGMPISTIGKAGETVTVLIFATDLLGARGDTATRRLIIE
jgi:hypothetical protein